MRVVVVGGSGRTGALVVKALVKAGDAVVATIRNPKHMAGLVKQGVEVAMLDLDKSPLADIEQAFKGADAVVFAAGSGEGEFERYRPQGCAAHGLAADESRRRPLCRHLGLGASTAVPKAFDTKEMKDYFKAKKAGEQTHPRLQARLDDPRAGRTDRGQRHRKACAERRRGHREQGYRARRCRGGGRGSAQGAEVCRTHVPADRRQDGDRRCGARGGTRCAAVARAKPAAKETAPTAKAPAAKAKAPATRPKKPAAKG